MPKFIIDLLGALFVIGLAISPLIFGGNVPLAWGFNALYFSVLLGAYLVGHLAFGVRLPVSSYRLKMQALTLGPVLIWIFAQAHADLPLAPTSIFWDRANGLLAAPLPRTVSVSPDETSLALLRLSTAALVFFLSVQMCRDPRRARALVAGIAATTTCYALYSMWLSSLGAAAAAQILPKALFKLDQIPMWTGPFINQNHFAIYIAIGLVCVWGLLLEALENAPPPKKLGGHREILAKITTTLGVTGRYMMVLVPLVIALFMTGSRAALSLTIAALLLPMFVRASRSSAMSLGMRSTCAILGLGVLAAMLLFGDQVGAKLVKNTLSDDIGGRIAVARVALRAVAESPFLGYGYGTFPDVFSLYQDDTIELSAIWKEAHNSYLEAILGLGLPMGGLLITSLTSVAYQCVRGAMRRQRDKLAPTVSAGTFLIIGGHALVDFSIQIQGVALTFSALAGAGFAQSWSSRDKG